MAVFSERVGIIDKIIDYCKEIYPALSDDGKFLFFMEAHYLKTKTFIKPMSFSEKHSVLFPIRMYSSSGQKQLWN